MEEKQEAKKQSENTNNEPKTGVKTHAFITSGDGQVHDLEGHTEHHIGVQPGAVFVEVDPKTKETEVKGAIKTHALVEKGAKLVEMDPNYPTNFWSNEHDTAYHVKGTTKPNVLVHKGAVLVEMDPKVPLNYWTNETGTAIDVKGTIQSNVLVNKGASLVEASASAPEVDVRGSAQSKVLLNTANVQLLSADADKKESEYDVKGCASSVAKLETGAILVSSSIDSKEIDVSSAPTNKALLTRANIQTVSSNPQKEEYDVIGSAKKVALIEENAKLVSMDTAVTTNFWTNDRETVYDIAGDIKSNILIKKGATLVEMDPSVILNYWTNEIGSAYDIRGDIKRNVLLQSGAKLVEAAPDAIEKGAAVIAVAKDSKAAAMEVEVKEVEVKDDGGVKDELNEDINDGMKRSLQILVDLNNEMASFEVNCNKLRMDKIGRESVDELIDGGSVLHKKLNRLHEIIRAIKVCSDGFIRSINGVEEYIESEYIPNTEQYKTWNINDIIIWIKSLDNGRFVKYIGRLLNGFKESEIINGDILPDLETADLSVTPFNIKNFKDKRDLIRNFKSLRSGKKVALKEDDIVMKQQDIMALIYESQKAQRININDLTYERKQVRTLNQDFRQYHD